LGEIWQMDPKPFFFPIENRFSGGGAVQSANRKTMGPGHPRPRPEPVWRECEPGVRVGLARTLKRAGSPRQTAFRAVSAATLVFSRLPRSRLLCPNVEAVWQNRLFFRTLFFAPCGSGMACLRAACTWMIEKADRRPPGGGHRADPGCRGRPAPAAGVGHKIEALPIPPSGVASRCGRMKEVVVARSNAATAPPSDPPTMCRWC